MDQRPRVPVGNPDARILTVRGHRVILDSDLAGLYGASTRRFNEAIKRNAARFPPDFSFRISGEEYAALMSQFATSKPSQGGRRKLPLVFTEHGAIMAAGVLNSPRAVEMSVYVVRAFVRLRQVLAGNDQLARKLAALEQSVCALDSGTRQQFEDVYAAIKALMVQPPIKGRPIGFTADLES
jgi:hypothetical protein